MKLSYLFTLVMYELKKELYDEIYRCMLFAYDIALVDKNGECLNEKLDN